MKLPARRYPLRHLVNVEAARRGARRRLPGMVFDFVEGGADDELTLRDNRVAFETVQLRPRALVDVSQRDQSVRVWGQQFATPILLAPVGLPRLAASVGEIPTARAARRFGTMMVLSSASTCTIEELAAAVDGPKWFQLYPWRDRVVTSRLMERAAAAGYTSLVLTRRRAHDRQPRAGSAQRHDHPSTGQRAQCRRRAAASPVAARLGLGASHHVQQP